MSDYYFEANKRMLRLIRRAEEDGLQRNGLDPELATLVDKGFVQRYGCIFLSGFEENARLRDSRKGLVDKTGVECFANHLHVKDYIAASALVQLDQGIMFAQRLAKALRFSFPRTGFRVIVSKNAEGVIVRFHKLRPNEEWLSRDLEGYEHEAVCVMTILANDSLAKRANLRVQ